MASHPQFGRLVNRRDVLEWFEADESTLPQCIVSPELTEGPYFVDEKLERSDIRSDPSTGEVREGALLELTLRVLQVDASDCRPFEGAMLDIWHCDALGIYSGVEDPGFDTTGQQFLRGYQVTDTSGTARFTTIYPGWYEGRSVHIHFKIRCDDADSRSFDFTSQFFFDENVTDQVHAEEPYVRKGTRTLLNEGDSIYQLGGDQLILAVTSSGNGYLGAIDIGIQMP